MPPMTPSVETLALRATNTVLSLRTQGTVQPRTQTSLIPEVSGRIVSISPSLYEGSEIEEGELLVEIEAFDYRTALIVASGNVASAAAALETEKAQAELALGEWRRSGSAKPPTDFYLRKPQLAAATARLASSEAQLEQAQRDLERTSIRAPYTGKVQRKYVDVGQYVTPGTRLADVFASGLAEVRLPLSADQLEYFALRDGGVPVRFHAGSRSWTGQVVRTEGAIDLATRQLFVIAQVSEGPPLGAFVQAEVDGAPLDDVVPIPRIALREDRYVVTLDGESKAWRRDVEVVWRDQDTLYLRNTLDLSERLCLTPVPFVVNGMTLMDVANAPKGPPAGAGRPGGPGAGKAGRPGKGAGQGGGTPRKKPAP